MNNNDDDVDDRRDDDDDDDDDDDVLVIYRTLTDFNVLKKSLKLMFCNGYICSTFKLNSAILEII